MVTLRSVEKNNAMGQGYFNGGGGGGGGGDGFDQIESGPLPSGASSSMISSTNGRPKGQTVIEKQVRKFIKSQKLQ